MSGYDRLTSDGKKFYAEIEKLAETEIFIGYQAGRDVHRDDEGNEVDMLDIAMFNELGTSRSPARPFIRQTADNHQAEINKAVEQIADQVVQGLPIEQGVNKLGALGVSLVQKTIRDGDFEPNAPSTVKKKGSDKPLIDTGQMRQSVHYVVRKKGDGN